MAHKTGGGGDNKPHDFADKRTLNPPGQDPTGKMPAQEHDPKNRVGEFEGTGEAPRQQNKGMEGG